MLYKPPWAEMGPDSYKAQNTQKNKNNTKHLEEHVKHKTGQHRKEK